MKRLFLILAVIGCLYLLHRLACWAEDRGWIYYRKHQAGSGSVGNALLQLQTLLEPSKRHVIEERLKNRAETQESGDKPKPGPVR